MSIELKYPVTGIIDGEKKEIKFLTAGRLKVKHFELIPVTLLNKGKEKQKELQKELDSIDTEIILKKQEIEKLSGEEKIIQEEKIKELKSKYEIKDLELKENLKKKLEFDAEELLPLFKELTPLLAGLFNLPIETIGEIDFEDIGTVIGALDGIFPTTEKKN